MRGLGLGLRFVLAMLIMAWPAFAENRVALVVGNAAYQNASALANPRNDARAIAEKLAGIGFDVILREDLDGQGFRVALGEFSEAALNADIALFFYAGHGIELAGQNFLIPVDAKMKSEATAQFETVPLEQVLTAVRSARKLGMIMLDACRDNPFAATMTRKNGTRAISRGLAPVSVEGEKGLLISFAAEAGRTADDGGAMHSPYTEALLEVIGQPGMEVGRMFRAVRAKVREKSGGQQVPIEQAQLPDEDIYLVAGAAPLQTQPQTPPPAPKTAIEDPLLTYLKAVQSRDRAALEDFISRYPDHIRAKDARALVEDMVEQEIWASATTEDTEAAYRNYLLVFPQGAHRADAEARLAALAPPATPEPPAAAYTGSCTALTGPVSVAGVPFGETLAVRAAPDANAAMVGELPFNAAGLNHYGCQNNWCQVEYGCTVGYAFQSYLTDQGAVPVASPEAGYYAVVDHPLDRMVPVQSGPSPQYAWVSELPPDATGVYVTDCQAQAGNPVPWCSISWNNVSGWVSGQYLMGSNGRKPSVQVVAPAPAAPAPSTTGQSCFDLWYARNQIFANNGYCFTSSEGKKWFDNASCYTSDPSLTAAEKAQVNQIKEQERAKRC